MLLQLHRNIPALSAPCRVTQQPSQCPQYPQYSRFQCCEKWIWLWDILELSALVSAQPDDVTQGLGSVGLPLGTGTGAESEPGLARLGSIPFLLSWVTQGWTLLEAAASTGFALKGDWPTCDHQEQFRSSGMRIPFSPLNPANLHIGNTNIPSFLPLLSSPAGENPSPPNSWGLKGFPGLFEEFILWFCPSVKASLELLCLSICSNTNPWGCSQFSSHRGKFA